MEKNGNHLTDVYIYIPNKPNGKGKGKVPVFVGYNFIGRLKAINMVTNAREFPYFTLLN